MGIKNLMSLLVEKAPESIEKITMESLSGRVLACDASIVKLNSFIVKFRQYINF